MSKRQRSELSQTLSLLTPPSGSVTQSTLNPHTNDAKFFVKEKRRSRSKKNLTFSQLYNLLCPSYKIKMRSIGSFVDGYTPGGAFTIQVQKPKQVIQSNLQNFASYLMLPFKDIGQTTDNLGNVTLKPINSISLSTLLLKARDISNFSMISARTAPAATDATFYFDQSVIYNGGYTKHTFVNTGNTDISFQFHIIRPRRPMMLQGEDNDPSYFNIWPAIISLNDKQKNAASGLYQPLNDATVQNQSTDLQFKYSSKDRGFNYAYTKITTRKLCPPGGTCVVTIDHPGFTFNSSEYLQALGSQNLNLQANIETIPNLLPFCSVILDVQATGMIGHDDAYTAIGLTAGCYTHHQEESHNLRAIPYQKEYQQIIRDSFNAQATETNLHMNEENEAEDGFVS